MKKQQQKQGKLKVPKILVVDKDKEVLKEAKKIFSSVDYKIFLNKTRKRLFKNL
jgi:FixJ family two-component response regulator